MFELPIGTIPYPLIARIRQRCSDLVSETRGTFIFRLPTECRLSLDEPSIARAVARLRDAPELDRDLSRYIVDIDQRLGNFADSLRRGRQFLALLH